MSNPHTSAAPRRWTRRRNLLGAGLGVATLGMLGFAGCLPSCGSTPAPTRPPTQAAQAPAPLQPVRPTVPAPVGHGAAGHRASPVTTISTYSLPAIDTTTATPAEIQAAYAGGREDRSVNLRKQIEEDFDVRFVHDFHDPNRPAAMAVRWGLGTGAGSESLFRAPDATMPSEFSNEDYLATIRMMVRLGDDWYFAADKIDQVLAANEGRPWENLFHDGIVRYMSNLNSQLDYESAVARYEKAQNTAIADPFRVVADDVVRCGAAHFIGNYMQLYPVLFQQGSSLDVEMTPTGLMALYAHSRVFDDSLDERLAAGADIPQHCDK